MAEWVKSSIVLCTGSCGWSPGGHGDLCYCVEKDESVKVRNSLALGRGYRAGCLEPLLPHPHAALLCLAFVLMENALSLLKFQEI